MSDSPPNDPVVPTPAADERWSDLDQLKDEIARRIRDNRRFLESFLDEEYHDDEEEDDDAADDLPDEEL